MNDEVFFDFIKKVNAFKADRAPLGGLAWLAQQDPDGNNDLAIALHLATAAFSTDLCRFSEAASALKTVRSFPLSREQAFFARKVESALLAEKGHDQEARTLMQSLLADPVAQYPENVDVQAELLSQIGLIDTKHSKYAEALPSLEKAESLYEAGEDRDRVGLEIAFWYQALGCPKEALVSINRVLGAGTGFLEADALYRKGGILLDLGKDDEAISSFRRAVERSAFGSYDVAFYKEALTLAERGEA